MRIYTLIYFIIFSSGIFSQADSVKIIGRLVDSYSHKPIENFEVILTKKYGTQIKKTKTDKNGKFEFEDFKSESIYIILSDTGYIEKHLFFKDTNSIVNLEFKLRSRKHTLSHYDIDSTMIGSKVKQILKIFSLDITDINEINEPPGISRGFDFELGDSTIVYIFTERTPSFRRDERDWMNQKIIGIGISRIDGLISYYGEGKPLIIGLYNKYLIEE
jgi:hypothetical protein